MWFLKVVLPPYNEKHKSLGLCKPLELSMNCFVLVEGGSRGSSGGCSPVLLPEAQQISVLCSQDVGLF